MATILIVDDEEEERLLQGSVLEEAGHELYFAQDGDAALRIYRDQAIDLVVTDLHMPKFNGLRLIQEIKELDATATIIAVSGVSADQLDVAEDFGAAYTLYKPLDPRDLLEAVDQVLERARHEGDVWGHEQ